MNERSPPPLLLDYDGYVLPRNNSIGSSRSRINSISSNNNKNNQETQLLLPRSLKRSSDSQFSTQQIRQSHLDQYYLTSPQGVISIVVSVTLFTIFICLFFFFYTVRIERAVVRKQITDIIEQIMSKLSNSNAQNFNYIQTIMTNVNMEDLKKSDEVVKKHNMRIIIGTVMISGIIVGIVVLFLIFMRRKYNVKMHYREMISHNLFVMIIIAATEILLLNVVVINYKTLDTNVVSKMIIDEVIAMKNT